MPSPSVIRFYAEDCFYHVYNRGVEKRLIFLDNKDYRIFLYYLFIYLAPPEIVLQKYPKLRVRLVKNNLYGAIELHAYCLMPNHFHLLLKQIEKDSLTKLMRRLTTAYTKYFNERYRRVGYLVQSKFKAKLVDSDEYVIELSRYIHRNPFPLQISDAQSLSSYPWSSYQFYLTSWATNYIKTTELLSYFSKSNFALSYRGFVEHSDSPIYLPENYSLDSIECLAYEARSDLNILNVSDLAGQVGPGRGMV